MRNKMPGITLSGDAEFAALLKDIPGTLTAECKMALNAVGKIITKKARGKLYNNHGYFTGILKKSLGVRKTIVYKNEGKIVMYVGTQKGYAERVKFKDGSVRKHDPFYIAHLVEFGHWIRTKADKKAGVVADSFVNARPFLRPAVDETRSEYISILKDKIKKVLAKRAAKAAKT